MSCSRRRRIRRSDGRRPAAGLTPSPGTTGEGWGEGPSPSFVPEIDRTASFGSDVQRPKKRPSPSPSPGVPGEGMEPAHFNGQYATDGKKHPAGSRYSPIAM